MNHWFFFFLFFFGYILPVLSFFGPRLGYARHGLGGARLSGLQCTKSDFVFSDAFVNELATHLKLGPNTTLTLTSEQLSPALLLAINRQDLERVYLIDAKDALKLSVWAQRKAREEELEAQRKAREEELEAQRKAREAKRALAKSVAIYNSERVTYMNHEFYGQSDLKSFMEQWQSAGLEASAPVSDGDELESSSSSSARQPAVITHLANLVNGSYYHHVNLPKSLVQRLQNDLANEARAKADYNTADLLTKHFGEKIVYRASCVNLTDESTGNSLGDIDTLLSSHNGSIVILLERKGSLSTKSVSLLLDQLNSTEAAFSACATRGDKALTNHLGRLAVNIREAKVYSAVYCKAGPDEVFQRLREMKVFVIKDGVELLAPV